MSDEFALVRVDFRLIHGQVITKWIKTIEANRIWVINDAISSDPFLGNIYKMAAPPNVKIEIFSLKEFQEKVKNNDLSKIMVLFKTVEEVYQSVKNGVNITTVQIGGLGAGEGRKNVFGPITLDNKDAKMLNDLSNNFGVKVVFHQVPDESSASLAQVLSKNNFDLS